MALEPSQFGSAAILNDRAIQERIAVALEAQLGGLPIRAGQDAFCITYVFPAVDFGGGTKTEDINGIPGYRATVRDITLYDVTEVWSDTDSEIDVGTQVADADGYVDGAEFGVLLAVNGALSVGVNPGVVGDVPLTDAGQDLIVTMVTPTTGTTGIATVAVTIQYFR